MTPAAARSEPAGMDYSDRVRPGAIKLSTPPRAGLARVLGPGRHAAGVARPRGPAALTQSAESPPAEPERSMFSGCRRSTVLP